MKLESITQEIHERLKQKGWQGRIVSIEHLRDLEKEIETHHQNGLLGKELYKAYLDRFDFNASEYLDGAQSLIVVTAPQPQQQVIFNRNGRVFPCIIPPTYRLATDDQIKDGLNDILKPLGYRLEKKRLPEKLISVRGGLARYGKNNITYVPGMGSFHRPAVFATDVPCEEDSWGESRLLKACGECTACMDACPTGAIVSDRFLVHAERCITFHNERRPDFPQWMDPSWHNSLVGCMICQNACPMNQKLLNWIEDGEAFSEKETDYLFKGVPQDNMLKTMIKKLEKLGMTEYAGVLGRNLKAIMENQ